MLTPIITSLSLPLLPMLLTTKKAWLLSTSALMMSSMYSTLLLFSPMTNPAYLTHISMTDPLSAPLITLTLWITSLMMMASHNTLNNMNSPKLFMIYVLTLNLTLVCTFSANNLLLFYIMFEASLIPTLMLIIGWGYQPERLQASTYLMLYTITASLPLLSSLLKLNTLNNHLSLLLPLSPPHLPNTLISLWWMITIAAFLVKMPMYLTHLWLPKAHVEAPVAGSMILAGVLLKLGSYGILRLSFMFQQINYSMTPAITSLALWGACITSMICLRQTDLKSLIAYSSVGHMGLMTAGIMSNSSWGWSASLTLMIAHGLCSSAMFALANMTYESTHTRNLYLTKGLLSLFPNMTTLWFIMTIANMAGPPSINLLSEIILMTSNLFTSLTTLTPMAIMSFLTAAYSLYLYSSTQHGSPLNYSNSLNLLSPINYSTITLHILPIYLLIFKPMIITLWL